MKLEHLLMPVREMFDQESDKQKKLISRQVMRFSAWLDRDAKSETGS